MLWYYGSPLLLNKLFWWFFDPCRDPWCCCSWIRYRYWVCFFTVIFWYFLCRCCRWVFTKALVFTVQAVEKIVCNLMCRITGIKEQRTAARTAGTADPTLHILHRRCSNCRQWWVDVTMVVVKTAMGDAWWRWSAWCTSAVDIGGCMWMMDPWLCCSWDLKNEISSNILHIQNDFIWCFPYINLLKINNIHIHL